MNKSEEERSREQIIKNVLELSPNSIKIVSTVIRWLYCYYEQKAPDKMTDEEMVRYKIALFAVLSDFCEVKELDVWRRAVASIYMDKRKEKRSKRMQTGK